MSKTKPTISSCSHCGKKSTRITHYCLAGLPEELKEKYRKLEAEADAEAGGVIFQGIMGDKAMKVHVETYQEARAHLLKLITGKRVGFGVGSNYDDEDFTVIHDGFSYRVWERPSNRLRVISWVSENR